MMSSATSRAMLDWIGRPTWSAGKAVEIDSLLWHVAERLEREGHPIAVVSVRKASVPGTSYEWYMGDLGPFPTKSDAVIAAWKHQTGATP